MLTTFFALYLVICYTLELTEITGKLQELFFNGPRFPLSTQPYDAQGPTLLAWESLRPLGKNWTHQYTFFVVKTMPPDQP